MNRGLAQLETTVFERMSSLARETGAINLGQGFPDWPGPPELLRSAADAVIGRSSQYPPMRGLPELRAAIADHYASTQGVVLQDGEIVVTSGATEALAASLLAVIEPGDDALLVQPLYDAYLPLVERAGGRARFVSLAPPDWSLSLADLEAAATPRTRVLVLNTPNNPSGSMLSAAELEALAAFCVARDIILICDEVWEATVFDDRVHASALAVPTLRDRTIKIGSAGKIFALTGWKVGWACAAPPLAEAVARAHQFLTFTTAPALQWAVAEGLRLPREWHGRHRLPYQRGRDRLAEGLTQAGFAVLPTQATWFQTIDLAASGVTMPDTEFCERLVREAGVAAIPISAFYAVAPETCYVRLCFAKADPTLDAAIVRLAAFRRRVS